jgi:hypothetical protein
MTIAPDSEWEASDVYENEYSAVAINQFWFSGTANTGSRRFHSPN